MNELLLTRDTLTQIVVEHAWARGFDSLRAARSAVMASATSRCRHCGKAKSSSPEPLIISETTFQLIVTSPTFRREAPAIKERLGVQTLVVPVATGQVRY